MHNRWVLDGILVAIELMNSRKGAKKQGIIFNIDMEKAYDHVGSGFVDYILARFGFGDIWRGWI